MPHGWLLDWTCRAPIFFGFGGSAEAYPTNHTWAPGVPGYQPGYSNCIPSLFRVEQSSGVTLANLWGDSRVSGGRVTDFNGIGTDPRYWSMLMWTAEDTGPGGEQCARAHEHLSVPLDKPVMFKLQ